MNTATTATNTRGPYRNGIRRREQITDSASQIFAEFGYAGGSIRTIAERVGVSPATLLQHFGSKEGLLMAVLKDWDRRTCHNMQEGSVRGLEFFRRFPKVMECHLRDRGLLELFLTMAAEASSPSHPAREFIQRRYADSIRDWSDRLREAVDAGEVSTMSPQQIDGEIRLLVAVLDGVELQWLLDPSTDLVGLISTYIEQTIVRWRT